MANVVDLEALEQSVHDCMTLHDAMSYEDALWLIAEVRRLRDELTAITRERDALREALAAADDRLVELGEVSFG